MLRVLVGRLVCQRASVCVCTIDYFNRMTLQVNDHAHSHTHPRTVQPLAMAVAGSEVRGTGTGNTARQATNAGATVDLSVC